MSKDEETKYLDLSADIDEMKYGSGGEKAVAGLKIFGKGIFNTFKFVGKEVVPKMSEVIEREKSKMK